MSKFQRVQLGVTAEAAAVIQRNVPVLSLMVETFHMSPLMMAGDIPCRVIVHLFIRPFHNILTEFCYESIQLVYLTAIASSFLSLFFHELWLVKPLV